MKEYLLGTLEPDQRAALEERILCDPQVYEELLIAERELIDQYEAGGLSKLEQQQFETHFLTTARRQKNLRFGQLLRGRVNSDPIHTNTAAPANKLYFYLPPFRKRPALAISGALVVFLGIVFFSWLMAQKPAEGLGRHNAPDHLVVTLSPSSIQATGSTQLLTLPTRGADVKLELELTNASFHNYKSQLLRESEGLETRDELRMEARGDHQVVPLVIPNGLLSRGDYQVRLSGIVDPGKEQFIDNYFFRVITK